MSCWRIRRLLSAFRDGVLGAGESQGVAAHLAGCGECSARWRSLTAALDALADIPRLGAGGEIVSRVFDRLDMEGRQPGLAHLVRSMGAARPLMLPSLVPAVLVLGAVLAGILAFGPDPLPTVAQGDVWAVRTAPSGTEGNPLFPSSDVTSPRIRAGHVPSYLLEESAEGSWFLETVVARDGSVSAVRLLEGDAALARPVLDALRQERFEPGRFRGRPVAVSVYRLISRMEVRSPLT